MAAKARSAPGHLPALRGWATTAQVGPAAPPPEIAVFAYSGVSTTEAELPARELARHVTGTVRFVSVDGGLVPGVEPARRIETEPLDRCVSPTILVLPGGIGWRGVANDADALAWIEAAATTARAVLTVSTGSLLLAATGLIDGDAAAGHWLGQDLLRKLGAAASGERVQTSHGNAWVTTAGTTAAVDAAKRLADHVLWSRPNR